MRGINDASETKPSVTPDTPQMRWGNPARVHAEGNIAAIRFSTEAAQYLYGAKWLRALRGTVWRDRQSGERGLAMSDMAVLVRTRKQMAPVAAALRAVGLDVLARGEDSLLVPLEAEALATAADYLAGVRTDPPRSGRGGPITSPVTVEDVKRTALAAGLAATHEGASCGAEYLTRLKVSAKWDRPLCLIEVMEEFLFACGYHVAFDGESSRFPVSSLNWKGIGHRENARSRDVAWYAIARVLIAAADFQRFGFSAPLSKKLKGFAEWLRVDAPSAYKGDEIGGGDDGLRVSPDAVALLTAHASKGLEWPAVWIPDLADGRFPLWMPASGSKVWNILPLGALTTEQARRADGEDGESDRLAYVSCTRSEAYLLATYAPPARWRNPKPSPYFLEIAGHPSTVQDGRILPEAARRGAPRLKPSPRQESRTITVTYSQLFTYWTCPRAFYLRFLVGFPPPLVPEIGYGESLHRAAKEVHERVKNGESLSDKDLEEIVLCHFHLPLAGEQLTEELRNAAIRALTTYHAGYRAEENGEIAYVEQEIRLDLGSITLIGRIDLATVLANGDIVLAEVKTEEAPSAEAELFAYGLGFAAGTGSLPDWVETRPIRANGSADGSEKPQRRMMDDVAAEETRTRIREAGESMTVGHFPMVRGGNAVAKCKRCDVRLLCQRGQLVNASGKKRLVGTA